MQNKSFVGIKYKNQTVWGIKTFSAPITYQDSLVNEARLVHVIKGNSSLVCSGKTLSLKAGDTLLMKADNFINQWLEQVGKNAVEFIGFRFTRSLIQELYQNEFPSSLSSNSLSEAEANDDESAVVISDSLLLSAFFRSVQQYTAVQERLTDAIITLKVKELIELVLSIDAHDKSPFRI